MLYRASTSHNGRVSNSQLILNKDLLYCSKPSSLDICKYTKTLGFSHSTLPVYPILLQLKHLLHKYSYYGNKFCSSIVTKKNKNRKLKNILASFPIVRFFDILVILVYRCVVVSLCGLGQKGL